MLTEDWEKREPSIEKYVSKDIIKKSKSDAL